ncbi:MAG: GNAT family N-acetyltransferase [Clostridiaceae bacterium]|nr:GNAT family N-acetyltransferase [Clostridiaceae bacterium]
MTELKEITEDNFKSVIALEISEAQKAFVAPNVYSIAQAKVCGNMVPIAVYNEGIPVGFLMYCMDKDDQEYWIYRFMIDKNYQRRGIGREAMSALLDMLKQDNEHHMVYISAYPENMVAINMYKKFGFAPDGRMIEGEVVLKLEY